MLKAGGAYVPLDPGYPEDRLSYMIEDSGIELLLTQGHLLAQLPVPSGLACLDAGSRRQSLGNDTNPHVPDHAGQPGLRDLHLRLHR